MSSFDMFDKTEAHRKTFNVDKGREDERRALPVETQAKVAALEAERRDKLAALSKDQERRTAADMKIQMQKASLEKPSPAYVPKFVSAWRNRETIMREATKSLAAIYAREKAAAVREIDREIKELTKADREEHSKSPEEITPDFTKAAGHEDREADEIAMTREIQAQWDAEADRDNENDPGREK